MSSVPPAPTPTPPSVSAQDVPGPDEKPNPEKGEAKKAYAELQKWVARLQGDAKKFASRNVLLAVLLCVGAILFMLLLGWIHQKTVGRYAVLKNVEVKQNPCFQGQIEISFEVVKPGLVYSRRAWGDAYTDICDDYLQPGHYTRPWSWTYSPGDPIQISLWFRSGLFRREVQAAFPTADNLDMVFIIDTTGSMDETLKALKEKCVEFARKVDRQALTARFALIGFGDTQDGEWVDIYDFTGDIQEFQSHVTHVKRYDGGDIPESALDALMESLNLNYSKNAIRRFYLVTDAPFHPKTADGKYDAQAVGKFLQENGILLDVFCRPQFQEQYRPLYGELGHYLELENFGKILSEGRVLED